MEGIGNGFISVFYLVCFFFAGVAPFSGATTGTGGRIRDVQCTGRGAHVVAGTAGYCFGNLHIPGSIFFFSTHLPFQVLCPGRHQHVQLLGGRVIWVSFLGKGSVSNHRAD